VAIFGAHFSHAEKVSSYLVEDSHKEMGPRRSKGGFYAFRLRKDQRTGQFTGFVVWRPFESPIPRHRAAPNHLLPVPPTAQPKWMRLDDASLLSSSTVVDVPKPMEESEKEPISSAPIGSPSIEENTTPSAQPVEVNQEKVNPASTPETAAPTIAETPSSPTVEPVEAKPEPERPIETTSSEPTHVDTAAAEPESRVETPPAPELTPTETEYKVEVPPVPEPTPSEAESKVEVPSDPEPTPTEAEPMKVEISSVTEPAQADLVPQSTYESTLPESDSIKEEAHEEMKGRETITIVQGAKKTFVEPRPEIYAVTSSRSRAIRRRNILDDDYTFWADDSASSDEL
jgi:hypothetical protein